MADPVPAGPDQTLTAARAEQIAGWRGGRPVSVEQLLLKYPPLRADAEAVLVLLCGEAELRAERGEVAEVARYKRRFPHLADRLDVQFAALAALGTGTSGTAAPRPIPSTAPFPSAPTPQPAPATLPQPPGVSLAAGTTADPNRTWDASQQGATPSFADNTPSSPATPARPAVALPFVEGYEVLGVLGRGGMGVVYKARDVRLGREVALKMVLSGWHAGPAERERFLAEARAVAQVKHPNVVQVYEVGERDGFPYFSLEFVAGGTLADVLKRDGRPDQSAAALLVARLADGVAAAHAQGVVHRDLKPANVLLTEDGEPKVTDFGLAKQGDSGLTATGAVMGTPSYMSPEQAAGRTREVGPPTDVYALGAILYECLTGRPPFKGATVIETLQQVQTDDPIRPQRLNPAVPRDLELICLMCLRKDAAKRYASAEQLADELRRFAERRPLRHTRAVGRGEKVALWCRRNPRFAAAGVVAGVALGAALTLTVLYSDTRARAEKAESGQKAATAQAAEAQEKERGEKIERGRELLSQGGKLAEQNGPAAGLPYLVQAAEVTPADAADAREQVRLHLAAWCRSAAGLVRVTIEQPSKVDAAAFSHDGKRILTRDLGQSPLRVWDAVTGEQLAGPFGGRECDHAVFADGGAVVVEYGRFRTRVWDIGTGKVTAEVVGPPGANRDAVDLDISPHPDGRTLVLRDGGRVWRCDIKADPEGKPRTLWQTTIPWPNNLARFTDPGTVTPALAVSPDGARVVLTGTPAGVRVLDAGTGAPVGQPLADSAGRVTVRFSADGKTIYLFSEAATLSEPLGVRAWDAATATPLPCGLARAAPPLPPSSRTRTEPQPRPVLASGVAADGKAVWTADAEAVQRWELAGGGPAGPPRRFTEPAEKVAFAPTGGRFLTVHGARLRVWDEAPEPPPAASRAYDHPGLSAAALSPDALHLLTTGRVQNDTTDRGELRVWAVETGEPVGPAARPGTTPFRLAFHPDGKSVLANEEDGTLQRWEAGTGQATGPAARGPALTQAIKSEPHRVLAYHPDGKSFVCGGGAAPFEFRDATTGEVKASASARSGVGVYGGGFGPDGAAFLPLYGDAWVGPGPKAPLPGPPNPFGNGVPLQAFAVIPLDPATGKSSGTRVRLGPGTPARSSFPGAPIATADIKAGPHAFTPDGRFVATVSPEIQVFETATGKPVGKVPVPQMVFGNTGGAKGIPIWGAVRRVALRPDGKAVAAAGPFGVAQFNSETGAQLARPQLPTGAPTAGGAVAYSPDGKFLAGALGTEVWVWDGATGKSVAGPFAHDHPVGALAFSPDGKSLAAGGGRAFRQGAKSSGGGSEARVWDLASGTAAGRPIPLRSAPLWADISTGGKTVLTGDRTAFSVWDADAGRPVADRPPVSYERDSSVAWSPPPGMHAGWAFSPDRPAALRADGRAALAGLPDGPGTEARVWDPVAGQPVGSRLALNGEVRATALSRDGRRAVVGVWSRGGEGRSEVVVWNTESGRPVTTGRLAGKVCVAALSPDGRFALAGSSPSSAKGNGQLRVWDAATGRELGSGILATTQIASAAFAPDGGTYATLEHVLRGYEAHGYEVRVRETATARPVGPPLVGVGRPVAVGFSADGASVVVCSCLTRAEADADGGQLRQELTGVRVTRWPVPAADGVPLARLVAWARLAADATRGDGEVTRPLSDAEWREAWQTYDPGAVLPARRRTGSVESLTTVEEERRGVAYVWPEDDLRAGKILAPDLRKATVQLRDEFDAPGKLGFHTAPGREAEYIDGRLVIRRWGGAWGNTGHVRPLPAAFEVTARSTSGRRRWGLNITDATPGPDDKPRAVGLLVSVGERGIEILPNRFATRPDLWPTLEPFDQGSFRKSPDWNTVLVVVRGQQAEVYLNGVAVCDPILLPFEMKSAAAQLVADDPDAAGEVEFDRYTVYSAAGVPSLPARGATPASQLPAERTAAWAAYRRWADLKLVVGGQLHPPLEEGLPGRPFRVLSARFTKPAQTTDDDIAVLAPLTRLRAIYAPDTRITDDGLRRLAGTTSLRVLHLHRTKVTDAGLEHLAGLSNLRELRLNGTAVTGAGLEKLGPLPNLWCLDLRETAGGDDALRLHRRFPDLHELWLNNTGVTDAGLPHLRDNKQLRVLDLTNAKVTDAGLASLRGLESLEALWLADTAVGDAGLEHLLGLTNLRDLWVGQTRVTADGVKKLRAALPRCRVTPDDPRRAPE